MDNVVDFERRKPTKNLGATSGENFRERPLVAFPRNSYHYLTDLSGIFPSHKISPCLMDNVVDFERRKPTKNLGATSGGNFRERPLVAEESDPDEEGIVVLPSTAVVNNDYFVSGRTVEISGTVNGDVYVYGGQVFIDGTINGDVLAAGGSIEVSGKVSNDVRLIAGQATISGEIGRNLTCLTATVELGPSAVIGGNIVVVSGNTDLESRVAQNVHLYSSSVRISNNVAGNVTAYVGHLRITSKANIGGILEYWSNKNALIAPEAKIAGGVTHHPSFFYKFFQGKFIKGLKLGSKLAALMMNFLYSFVIGLILIRYFPFRITRTIETLNAKPAQSLVAGLVLIFLLPIVMLALIVTI
ncbi:MAG: polymer-forming cytoskeletal protein [Chlamydiia bacterium]|nr:polymer-forming cytoskeletal protein [Chlamydiia bacterium]